MERVARPNARAILHAHQYANEYIDCDKYCHACSTDQHIYTNNHVYAIAYQDANDHPDYDKYCHACSADQHSNQYAESYADEYTDEHTNCYALPNRYHPQ